MRYVVSRAALKAVMDDGVRAEIGDDTGRPALLLAPVTSGAHWLHLGFAAALTALDGSPYYTFRRPANPIASWEIEREGTIVARVSHVFDGFNEQFPVKLGENQSMEIMGGWRDPEVEITQNGIRVARLVRRDMHDDGLYALETAEGVDEPLLLSLLAITAMISTEHQPKPNIP